MGIGHIFKIDDRYTNIDRWSIIGDNYLLNVLTDYRYSNSIYFKSMLHKSKDLNKIVSYIYLQTTIFPFAIITLKQNKTSFSYVQHLV
jgi:prolyl-tRNA synthetase